MAVEDEEFRPLPAAVDGGEHSTMSKQLQKFLPPPPGGRTVVIGAGANAAVMAQSIEMLWPARARLSILVVEESGEEAAQRILRSVRDLSRHDLVICLICEGTDELFDAPVAPLTRSQKQHIVQSLLRSDATVEEIACVQKHLSLLEGGRLAAACAPARVVTLVTSAQVGAHSAGGPTLPDPSTCNDALAVILRYHIDVPQSILSLLTHGELETPKPIHSCFAANEVRVLNLQ